MEAAERERLAAVEAAEAKRNLPWKGWYQQNDAKNDVDLEGFKITEEGHIEGAGSDTAGTFTFDGEVDTENSTVDAIKEYPTYKIFYSGTINEEQTQMQGKWGFSKGDEQDDFEFTQEGHEE